VFKFIPRVALLQELIIKATTFTKLDELDVDKAKIEAVDKKPSKKRNA
jgi:hypothetical protein